MKGRKVLIRMNVEDVVVVTEDHGGYLAGRCSACNAGGWIEGYGYPHGTRGVMSNHMKHKANCSMNRHLNADASLKRNRKRKR